MTAEQMREQFEAWYSENYTSHLPMWNGEYANLDTLLAWKSWQAAMRQAVPEGFIVVPKEPTDEMLPEAWNYAIGLTSHDELRHIYRTMIAAAPSAPDGREK